MDDYEAMPDMMDVNHDHMEQVPALMTAIAEIIEQQNEQRGEPSATCIPTGPGSVGNQSGPVRHVYTPWTTWEERPQ